MIHWPPNWCASCATSAITSPPSGSHRRKSPKSSSSANEESAHADRLAQRIVQLGGEPDFSPDSLTERSHAEYDDSKDLKAMIRANLVAERVAIESYSQIIGLIGDKDPSTRRLVEDILHDEQEHAEELTDWLAD